MNFCLKLLFMAVLWLAASSSWADVSNGVMAYIQGVQSYQAKDYQQGAIFFTDDLRQNPNHVEAIRGRANCNYYLGHLAEALKDYQRVQVLQPSPAVAQIILYIQDSISSQDKDFKQGALSYKAGDYLKASKLFTADLARNPNHVSALRNRAHCYYYLNRLSECLADYRKAQALQPSPVITQFVQSIQKTPASQGVTVAAALSTDVPAPSATPSDSLPNSDTPLAEVSATDVPTPSATPSVSSPNSSMPLTGASTTDNGALPTPAVPSQDNGALSAVPSVERVKPDTVFGLRVYTQCVLLNLADFVTGINTSAAYAQQAHQTDSTTTFSANYPVNGFNVVLEPTYRLDSHWEIGLPLSAFYSNSVSIIQYSQSQGPDDATYAISAFGAGLNLRYFLESGDLTFEFAGGPLIEPMTLQYTGVNTQGTVTGSTSAVGFGGQIQAGVDWHIAKGWSIGPLVGYQVVSASSFHGTVSGIGSSSTTGTWTMVPTSLGEAISLLPDGTTAPSGSRPLTVDLSGFTFGLQAAVDF